MKKFVLLVLILVVSYQFVESQTNPQGHYKIDLKTKMSDKKDLKPLKKGLKELISQSKYFENKEFGEDYSLWILSPFVSKTIQPDGSKRIVYKCILELRTPAAFSDGKFIASREIEIDYVIDKEQLDKLDNPDNNIGKFIAELGQKYTDPKQKGLFVNLLSLAATSSSGGSSIAAELAINQVCKIMIKHYEDQDNLDYKAEFYIVGGELYNKLTEMIIELENK